MRLAVLVFCCALAFGQNTSSAPETKSQAPANSPDQKSQKQDYGLGKGAPGRQMGALDILSDTQGVDFGPYLQDVIKKVRQSWYDLIPSSASTKKGKLAIEFAINKDGKVADMRLVARDHGPRYRSGIRNHDTGHLGSYGDASLGGILGGK